MAEIDLKKLSVELSKVVEKTVIESQKAVEVGMIELRANFINRIFKDGLATNGGLIGYYSTKPIYVSISGAKKAYGSQVRSSSLKGKGKYSSKDFANGKKRRSQYMAGGYAEFRTVVGRKADKVNLDLTGTLKGSIQLGQRQNTISLEIRGTEEPKKAAGLEKHFGKTIFAVSSEEIKPLVDSWREETAKAFYNSFK